MHVRFTALQSAVPQFSGFEVQLAYSGYFDRESGSLHTAWFKSFPPTPFGIMVTVCCEHGKRRIALWCESCTGKAIAKAALFISWRQGCTKYIQIKSKGRQTDTSACGCSLTFGGSADRAPLLSTGPHHLVRYHFNPSKVRIERCINLLQRSCSSWVRSNVKLV